MNFDVSLKSEVVHYHMYALLMWTTTFDAADFRGSTLRQLKTCKREI